MLIAEVVVMVVVGAQSAAHPALQTSHCEKQRAAGHTGSDIKGNQTQLHLHKGNMYFFFLYRSWVPDENLGAAVGELVCQDLEVIHQNLNSFPRVSQKGHMGHPNHTWRLKIP